MPLAMLLAGAPSEQSLKALGENYRYLWSMRLATKISVGFGRRAKCGPFL